ncbi:MAG TPA: NAD(P)-binding domain-containing protein, partial [Gaiellaceae bacterium]|nr:NAD(P)-binding domain-containing protein [Gaiellaceae bacterium]
MSGLPVVVVGAGQAGLAISRELTKAGVEHVVLERGRVGETWRGRWDSFCVVTPNWSIRLPDGHYDGTDPDGFMPRDEIVAWLERYAASSHAPVREHVEVQSLESVRDGFALVTSDGVMNANAVVLATGAYQRPYRPGAAETLPPDLFQIDVEGYRNEGGLPPGRVLVVGSGQSGCQIAEELHQAGRDVVLACGRAPWLPRRWGGRDLTWWAQETGFLDVTVESLPDPSARLFANLLATGHGGGHDLHLRTLQAQGVVLAGHLLGAANGRLQFADDLAESVAWGDERYLQFRELVRNLVAERGLDDPGLGDPEPFAAAAPESLDSSDFGAVIFTGGFRPDHRSWLPWRDAFDEHGFPIHRDGASTVVPGLYFVGVHFLRKRKSALLIGVAED